MSLGNAKAGSPQAISFTTDAILRSTSSLFGDPSFFSAPSYGCLHAFAEGEWAENVHTAIEWELCCPHELCRERINEMEWLWNEIGMNLLTSCCFPWPSMACCAITSPAPKRTAAVVQEARHGQRMRAILTRTWAEWSVELVNMYLYARSNEATSVLVLTWMCSEQGKTNKQYDCGNQMLPTKPSDWPCPILLSPKCKYWWCVHVCSSFFFCELSTNVLQSFHPLIPRGTWDVSDSTGSVIFFFKRSWGPPSWNSTTIFGSSYIINNNFFLSLTANCKIVDHFKKNDWVAHYGPAPPLGPNPEGQQSWVSHQADSLSHWSSVSNLWRNRGVPKLIIWLSVRVWPCISNSTLFWCISKALPCTLMHCVSDSTCYATPHHPLHLCLHMCCPCLFVCLFPLPDCFH